jgi:hypothetical protein
MRTRISRKTRRRLLAVVSFGLSALLLGGCDLGENKYTEPWNDAPRMGAIITEPVEVIANADGFSNLSTGCSHGNRWYVLYHADAPYGGISVVANDPSCKGKP